MQFTIIACLSSFVKGFFQKKLKYSKFCFSLLFSFGFACRFRSYFLFLQNFLTFFQKGIAKRKKMWYHI